MVKSLLKNSKQIFSRQHSSILSAALVIAAAYLLSAGLGLIRNRLLASHFFGGQETDLDVYFAAFVIPDTVFQLIVVGALSVAFIPVYGQYLKKGNTEANELVNATLNATLIFLVGVTAFLFVFARQVSQVITHFPPAQIDLMINLMRIMLISQILFALSAFMTAIIQAHHRFLIPAIAPLFYNLGSILGIIFLAPRFGIYGAAFGVLLGAFLHLAIQLPLSFHLGFRYRLLLARGHQGVRTIRRLMLPRTIALSLVQLERWVVVFFSTLFSAGSLSIFNFGRQLYVLPISLFGVSLGQASFPTLSDQANDHDYAGFRRTLSNSILQIFFFSLPASLLLLILRIPLVRLSFGADNFPWEATLTTGRVVAILALSLAPQAATHIFIRAFHALHDSKTPLWVGVASLVGNIILSFLLTKVWPLDVLGLAWAMTIANILSALLLLAFLERKVGRLFLYATLSKMLVVSFFTSIFLWGPMRFLDQFVFDTTRTVPLILLTLIVSLIGMSVYFAFSHIFAVPQLQAVTELALKIGNWRKVLSESDEVLETPNNP